MPQPGHKMKQRPSAQRRTVISIPAEAGLQVTDLGLVGPSPSRHIGPMSGNKDYSPLLALRIMLSLSELVFQALNGPEE